MSARCEPTYSARVLVRSSGAGAAPTISNASVWRRMTQSNLKKATIARPQSAQSFMMTVSAGADSTCGNALSFETIVPEAPTSADNPLITKTVVVAKNDTLLINLWTRLISVMRSSRHIIARAQDRRYSNIREEIFFAQQQSGKGPWATKLTIRVTKAMRSGQPICARKLPMVQSSAETVSAQCAITSVVPAFSDALL